MTNYGRSITKNNVDGDKLSELWTSQTERFPRSREVILACRDLENGVSVVRFPPEISDDETFRHYLPSQFPILPHRRDIPENLVATVQTAVPVLHRTARTSSPTAIQAADQLEISLHAAWEQVYDWDWVCRKSVCDAQWATVVIGTPADWVQQESFLDTDGAVRDQYKRDGKGRKPADKGYSGYDATRSAKDWHEARDAYLSGKLPVTVRHISPLDCVPLMGPRNSVDGLLIRSIYEREELLREGYVWDESGAKDACKLQPTYHDSAYGRSPGEVYLYELFWREPENGHIMVAYCVGARSTGNTKQDVAIDLTAEYGIWRPVWRYNWSQMTASDNPDHWGVPILERIRSMVVNFEESITIQAIWNRRTALGGSVVPVDEKTPPQVFLDGDGNLRELPNPLGGKVVYAANAPVPITPARLGENMARHDALYLSLIQESSPGAQNYGGDSTSGHQIVVSQEALSRAKHQVTEAIRADAEWSASMMFEWLVRLSEKHNRPIPVAFNVDVIPDGKSASRPVSEIASISADSAGTPADFTLRMELRAEATLAEKQQALQFYESGVTTFEQLCNVLGISNWLTQLIKVRVDQYYRTGPGLALVEDLANQMRGETEQQKLKRMQAEGRATEGGMPTDLMGPLGQQLSQQGGGGAMVNPQAGPGGMGPGVGPAAPQQPGQQMGPTSGQASLSGIIGGERRTGAMQHDAQATSQMGAG